MERARQLRRNQTDAEAKLWACLRAGQLGTKFRRQHRVDGYILDFACLEQRLAIELDGGQHFEQAAYDERRTAALERLGFRVLRFWNNDALSRTDEVLESIVRALNAPPPPHPNPLPPLRRGRGSKTATRAARGTDAAEAAPSPPTVSPPPHTEPLPPLRRGRGSKTAIRAARAVDAAETTPSPPTVSGERVGVRGKILQSTATQPGDPPARKRHAALRLRARFNTLARDFFAQRGVAEVTTPVLSAAGNTEPNIEGFSTLFTGPAVGGARERFLRTSPEYPLKRLLSEGFGDCYELGPVFRNGEAGASHNPEFTLLEWYRTGFDHRRLMLETAQFVRAALGLAERDADVTTVSYRDWFRRTLKLDPLTDDIAVLRAPLAQFHIDPSGLERDDWLDLLVTHRLQPALPPDAITIVYDFPATQCSLARIRAGHPPVAERFELYLGRQELANGYHELNDAAEQRARFQHDNARRAARGQRELPLDDNLLAVLDRLPDCAGVALGVERLLMHLAGTGDIRDVLAFPFAEV